MSDLFLDLRETLRVIDFLVENLLFAPRKLQAEAEAWIAKSHEGECLSRSRLAEFAKKFGWKIWPARFALKRFFEGDGSELEWTRVCAAVRPSTAHLLRRFRAGTGAKTLDEALRHAEVEVALREGDCLEVETIRAHLKQEYWRDHAAHLKVLVKAGEREVEGYEKRLASLRELAVLFPSPGLQDEIFSKIERYEDRILFEGEVVPLEILDEEIAYYRDQKEIAPVES